MSTNSSTTVTLDKIVSLCKRRGFVYPSADIYGGLNGVYDFGPLGTLLKDNIKSAWKQSLRMLPQEILFLDGAILGAQQVWQASGHVGQFHDPMIECLNCKHRFRVDEDQINTEKPCKDCGVKAWGPVREFNMMFQTNVGAAVDGSSIAYLRPETAQTVFVNFKNVMSTNRVKIPFGIGQIGKAFRNEITPKQFLFRMREFEQMELEWFCTAESSEEFFKYWCEQRLAFYNMIGLDMDKLRLRAHEKDELSHYSTQTSDIEYEFPFGWKEIEGIAHRGTFDLTQHTTHSGKDLAVHDEVTKTSFTPTIVECSVGVDRMFLTLLFDAYDEDMVEGEQRTVLRLHPDIAPIKAAFCPLVKKISEPMERLYNDIKHAGFVVQFDETGSIGKRYRRQDEIGTPVCFTYDFESEQDHCVTARDRDTTTQERISMDRVVEYLDKGCDDSCC